MYANAVYFPNHMIYQGRTPGMLNYGCINHVYYAFANVLADGSVFVSLLISVLTGLYGGVFFPPFPHG
jgi:hypothetical protein